MSPNRKNKSNLGNNYYLSSLYKTNFVELFQEDVFAVQNVIQVFHSEFL